MLNDENWSKVHEIGRDKASCEQVKALSFESASIPKEGSEYEQTFLSQLIEYKSQVWFFIIADCSLKTGADQDY